MNAPNADPVIDEIRATRHAISERFGHDPARLTEYLAEIQKRYRDRLLDPPEPAARQDPSAA